VSLSKSLRHANHEVVDCDIGNELATWLEAHESSYDIDLAFIDCKVLLAEDDLISKIEKALGNEVPVVILTAYPCRQICFRTSTLAIAGWLTPPISAGDVEKQVNDVLRKHDRFRPERESAVPNQPLTPRERVILRLLVRGLDNDEIAHCLGISPETVHYHLKHVFEKLRVKSRTEAAALAREISLEPVKPRD
jgi:DNA-binding NarL/FixJ family response regulator